jgi:hypothetical protein
VKGRVKDAEGFIRSLGNATEFTLNLTGLPDPEFFDLKKAMDENRDVIPNCALQMAGGKRSGEAEMNGTRIATPLISQTESQV